MTAKIITVANQKGGSGKTTISMQIGGNLGRRGYSVLIVDADPQGTAMRWAAQADDAEPFPADVVSLSAAGGKVHREVKRFVDKYDFVIVDCPPAVESPVPESALLVSDLALVPVSPSPADLWATTGIEKLVERAQIHNEDLVGCLVANRCKTNTTVSKEAMEILAGFNLLLAKTRLCHRTVYEQSAAYGVIVHSLDDRPASQDVRRKGWAEREVKNLVGKPVAVIGEVLGLPVGATGVVEAWEKSDQGYRVRVQWERGDKKPPAKWFTRSEWHEWQGQGLISASPGVAEVDALTNEVLDMVGAEQQVRKAS